MLKQNSNLILILKKKTPKQKNISNDKSLDIFIRYVELRSWNRRFRALVINNSTQEEAGHPVYACRFRASLFLPELDTAYWMLRGPLCNLRRANSERAVGRSLLAPRFPLACPRVILHAVGASRRRQRQSYKVEPSATVDMDTHVSDAARTRAFISDASELKEP